MKVFKCSSYQISIASMFIAHCIAIHSHLDTANKAIKILMKYNLLQQTKKRLSSTRTTFFWG